MNIKVCKFGGTSMATAEAMKQSATVVLMDKERKFVVVSAPGKRHKGDEKVTDLLYACEKAVRETGSCDAVFSKIDERFSSIVADLKIDINIRAHLDEIKRQINSGAPRDFCASRGEYLAAIVFAALLKFTFVDAAKSVFFFEDGTFDSEYTNDMTKTMLLKAKKAVIPGFYGSLPSGMIKTFSRGGSDISGAIVARAVNAKVYENWTDVSGFMVCDPKIVENPRHISMLSYKELRELSYMGAEVLHPDSIFPVRKSDIPINIRNTFRPEDPGTMIVPSKDYKNTGRLITGIAGKKGFVTIHIEKSMMNSELGFARRALTVLEHYGVSVEHMPSGIDTMTLLLDPSTLPPEKIGGVVERLKNVLDTDRITVVDNMAVIATVGHGMSAQVGTAARLFGGLAAAGVNVRMIDQGSSEMNIIIGVNNDDFEKAVKTIYDAFDC